MYGTRGAKKEKLTISKGLESTTQQFLTPLPCRVTVVLNQIFKTVNEITPNQTLPWSTPNSLYRAKISPLTKPLVVVRFPMESLSLIDSYKRVQVLFTLKGTEINF